MNFYDKDADKTIYFGNVPHLRQNTVGYYVTFRTADSIPLAKVRLWIEERDKWLKLHPEPHSDQEIIEYNKYFSHKIEFWLDQSHGECILRDQRCKKIVKNALLHFHEKRYLLWEYAVASNHVHIIIEPYEGFALSDILHSIKSFTAKEINNLLGRSGQFWQKEYFDHIIRSEVQLERFTKYIRNHEKK